MNSNSQYNQYISYKEKKTELALMLKNTSDIIAQLNMQQFQENLRKLSEKVENETFKVQIVGTFKNGKSTFINSLLGEKVLPAYTLPATAIVNEVKWGESKKAIVHFKSRMPEKLLSEIPPTALEHMKKYNMKDVPPMEVPYDAIEDYAVIPIDHAEERDYESPYEKIEIFWPLPLLQNGVEIIDSPGLNECSTRTEVTMNYIAKADAILFVLDGSKPLSADEMGVMENTLKAQGFNDPFVITNKFDLIDEDERDRVRRYIINRLTPYTTNGFFFVSSFNALKGKLKDDPALLNDSGIPEFEGSLSEYLTVKKGKAKLSQPSNELKRIINDEALKKTIPVQRGALSTSLDEVKERYAKIQPRLGILRKKKTQLLERLTLNIEQHKGEFKRMMSSHLLELSDSVVAWIEECQPQNKIGMFPKEAQITAVVEEIIDYVTEKLEANQIEWRQQVLEPVLSEKTNLIFSSAENDLASFFSEIDKIHSDMANIEYDAEGAPVWQRVSDVIGGADIKNIHSITGGFKNFAASFAKGFVLELGAMLVLNILGMLNPVTLAATIVFAVIAGGGQGNRAIKKIKEEISKEVVNQLTADSDKNATDFAEDICSKYNEFAEQITGVMDTEINEVENQINGIIADMEKGKEQIARREAVINECEMKLKAINIEIDDLAMRISNI